MKKKQIKEAYKELCPFFVCLSFCLVFNGCGIEDYPYIPPVPSDYAAPSLNDHVVLRIPTSASRPPFFTHYAIYYKIYISDILLGATTDINLFSEINATLYSDYNAIAPYLEGSDSTTGSTATDSLFSNRKFKPLEFENVSMDDYWRNITSNSLTIDFTQATGIPVIEMEGKPTVRLLRFMENNVKPLPDNRYFVNDRELYNSENINENTNTDIVDQEGSSEFPETYTYICMYVVSCGLNVQTYTPIFSSPTFLHVMRLPEPW